MSTEAQNSDPRQSDLPSRTLRFLQAGVLLNVAGSTLAAASFWIPSNLGLLLGSTIYGVVLLLNLLTPAGSLALIIGCFQVPAPQGTKAHTTLRIAGFALLLGPITVFIPTIPFLYLTLYITGLTALFAGLRFHRRQTLDSPAFIVFVCCLVVSTTTDLFNLGPRVGGTLIQIAFLLAFLILFFDQLINKQPSPPDTTNPTEKAPNAPTADKDQSS